jgi:hypothetical protein
MNNGLKFSRPGHSVNNDNPSTEEIHEGEREVLPALIYGIAMTYFHGAKLQLERYNEAYKVEHPPTKVQLCMHEASCLFEDLSTVGKYAEMCGDSHELHKLWLDVRNHIRHDIREGMDVQDDTRKQGRAERLGIHPNLQMDIGFDEDAIKVGSTVIELAKIVDYLVWAGGVMEGVLKEAIGKRQIEGLTYEGRKERV